MKQEWQRTLLAVAVACACGAATLPAQALTLGRITVQSALGQPLQAEVDLPDITPEEARTLQATIAGPEAFRAAGLDYSPALAGVRITPQRRADGRMVLRISSEQPVQAPFIDLILQANWAAGRVVRDYTLLLDAPSAQGAVAPATAPQLPPAASPPVTAAAPPSPSPAPPPQPVAAPPVTTAPAAPPPPPASPPTAASAESLTVRRGDTAGRIAASNKAPEVSLDQMLVAMLRNNPQAFIAGNVNLLRAGSVLDLPSAEQAASIPQPEAARTIAAQARDFNAYRSRLAGQVAAVPGEAERSASGRVQAQVEEARPAAAATDKLTLSKGGAQARAREEQIARDKAASDSSERVAELSRNIEALNKLGAGAAPAQPPAAAPEPAPVPAPAPEPSPAATVEAPVPSPAPLPPAPAPQTDGGEGGLPGWLPAAGLALAALLAGLFVVRSRRRRATVATPAAPGPADALVASSGGQHVDTESAPSGPSTLSYSLSQFDANEEVDPIAEADVYLAYGRDLQAEEILKEALRTTPERVALHVKLAEIYDKRRDAAAFVKTAEKVHALTSGNGADWDRVAAWGRDLQPDHALWRSSATAVAAATATATAAALAPAPGPADTLSEPGDPVAVPPPPALDIDLDLDLDDLQPPPPTPSTEPLLADSLDFDVDASSPLPSAPAADPLPFDLGSLSLDLGDAPAAPAANAADAEPDLSNPLATKLALAEEFQAIGDADGARALAEEVLAEAEGPLKVQAQRFLAELG